MPEVAIIGGGPTGSLTANVIASSGFEVHVLEEHSEIGKPNHCAGMISVEGLKRLNVDPSPEFVQNKVFGGRVYSPDGDFIEIRSKRPKAFIVNRAKFDNVLADKAMNKGAVYNLSSRVEQLRFKEHACIGVKLSGSNLVSQLVVDAEGPRGSLLKRSGIDTGQRGLLTGYNVELEDVDLDPEIVELWFSDKTAKGLFAWVIPLSEGNARCGLATSRIDGAEKLKAFIKRRFGLLEVPQFRGGVVCTGGPIRRTVYNGLMVIGDAAGQVKPTTGGGVTIGGLCAIKAGEVAVEALEAGDISPNKLYKYESGWRDAYGRELRSMLVVRKLLNGIGDNLFNRTLHSFKKEGLEENLLRLVEKGDMDMQSGVIKLALADTSILSVLIRSLGRAVVGELLSKI